MKRESALSILTAGTLISGVTLAFGLPALSQETVLPPETLEVCDGDYCIQVRPGRVDLNSGSQEPYFEEPIVEDPTLHHGEDELPICGPEPCVSECGGGEPQPIVMHDRFFCDSSSGIPTTFVTTAEGSTFPLIHWTSSYFSGSGYDPQTRCNQVTSRFNQFAQAGMLNYITTGIVNNLPVVCVSSEMGGPCTGVLFTLKPHQNPANSIQQLFDVRIGAAGPLYESSSRIYINLSEHLETLSQR
ncbi:MAG: COP23 domain-containing protein [Cyanobacteria bacterium SID2]|nr:COP23 domain-containing protein [Cyanobacteria bacterium SID2]MBP0002521.1 COP23 domain-containing protein [Cyanobacteria bacterium SBC]